MSQAFMKEGDAQWLHEIPPTVHALQVFLTSENNGITVYEKKNYFNEELKAEIWEMTNGMAYRKNADGKWMEVLEF